MQVLWGRIDRRPSRMSEGSCSVSVDNLPPWNDR
jgi:hypothetical protein